MFNFNKNGMGVLTPVPRFFFFCIVSLLSTFFTYNWIGIIVSGSFIFIIYLAGKIYNKLGLITSTVAGILSFFGNIFIHHSGEIVFSFGPLILTSGGLETGSILGLRLFFMILFAVAYISVTPLEDLFDTFKSLYLPLKGQIYLMIVLRYIDLLNKEFTTIKQSMSIRGINWDGSVLEKIKGLKLIPVPIIFRLIGHIHQQTLAVDNLGGISNKKINIEEKSNVNFEISKASVTYNLSKNINPNEIILDKIDLKLNKGERAILIGLNGSGKTSTLILARGLISTSVGQYTGDVNIFGNNIKSLDLYSLAELSRIVFPSAAHGLVGIRVIDELNLSLHRSRAPKNTYDKIIHKTLLKVGLNNSFLNRKTLSLSGGQQQRVALASALIANPRMLFFDEVSGQLDPIGKEEIFKSIENIEKSQSILVSEANFNPYNFDKIFLVKDKKITEVFKTNDNFLEILKESGRRIPILLELSFLLKDSKIINNFSYAKEQVIKNKNNFNLIKLLSPEKYPINTKKNKILDITNLSFSYDKKIEVLKDINLSFYENEITSILGANGSGKSTLSLVLCNVLKATKGYVDLRNKYKIGYIFQEPSYQILCTKVKDELAFGPKQLKLNKIKIEEIVKRECKRFNLNPEDNPINLSSEDMRKLTIGSILAIDSDIIIFDEPTNTLDENEINNLFEIIKKLKESGKTIILISHDVYLSWKYAERIIVMKDGKIEIDGQTNQIMEKEELLRSCNITVPEIAKIYNKLLYFSH
tara:strand:- start:212 stop:2479 length:2268 start_codon:yes stop_codon:yes gene_type:complete